MVEKIADPRSDGGALPPQIYFQYQPNGSRTYYGRGTGQEVYAEINDFWVSFWLKMTWKSYKRMTNQ